MESPLVSIVIVTWNRKEDVLETVRGIYEQSYRHFEIVVVDNGSTDGTSTAVRQAYPSVNLVELDRNTGASTGRNAGITAAQGEIVFILDSDASLGHETLCQVVRKFQAEPDLGVIACKVVNAYTKELDRTAGWLFSEKDKVDQDRQFFSFRFSECGCAIRREVFAQSGLFWDVLFFGREGEELSLRIWDAGYKILYCGDMLVYHRVSPQKRLVGGDRLGADLRNWLYMSIVRYPWRMLLRLLPLKIASALVQGIRKRCLRHMLRAMGDVIKNLPALLRERKPIQDHTARRYIGLLREHGPLRWDLMSWLKYKA